MRSLSERQVAVLALGACLGARVAAPVPLIVPVACLAVAIVASRPWVLVVAVALLATWLGARAVAGMVAPPSGEWRGRVVLLTDPEPIPGGVRADVRAGSQHLLLRARGDAATVLHDAWAGQRVRVTGRRGALHGGAAARVRHIAGQIDVTDASVTGDAGVLWRWGQGLRRRIVQVAAPLPPDERSLLLGFVLGDDRGQREEVAADFRAAGLTHLLVVSGENVALLLALAGPVLRRCSGRARWGLTLALLGLFTIVTRGEPSVLRAVAMTAIASSAVVLGRPASGRRALALAVTALVLFDPFLSASTGFLLSVSASMGILLFAVPITRAIPGPRVIARVLGVTGAAQLGVAPVMLATFGGLPIAALPANLLAAPAAAGVVVVGVPLLMLASLFGPLFASTLVGAARLPLRWVLAVARWGARVPLGHAGALVVMGCAICIAALALAEHTSRAGLRRAGRVALLVVLLLPAAQASRTPPRAPIMPGVWVVRGGDATVVLLAGAARSGDVLEALARVGVRRVDLLVLRDGGARAASLRAAVGHRWTVRAVLAPRGHRVPGGHVPPSGSRWRVGTVEVFVTDAGPPLHAVVRDKHGVVAAV